MKGSDYMTKKKKILLCCLAVVLVLPELLPPQAARPATIATDRRIANDFFIDYLL